MSDNSKLEERLFRNFFDDGLLDLFAGLAIALIGTAWIFDQIVMGAIVPALLMPFWAFAKKRFIEPIAGTIKFKKERKIANKSIITKWLIFGVAVLIAQISFFIFGDRSSMMENDLITTFIPALPAVLIAIPLTLIGLYLKIGRFSLYGTITVIFGMLATYDIGFEPGHTLFLSGVIIILIASFILRGFVNNHSDNFVENDSE